MKVIRIDDTGYIWEVPLETIAKHRADYYAERDQDTTFQAEYDYVMEDPHEGLDWFLNNMDFKDVEKDAKFVRAPEPLKKPRINTDTCECEIAESA